VYIETNQFIPVNVLSSFVSLHSEFRVVMSA